MAQSINREQELDLEIIAGGTITEAIAGAGAVALTILALVHVLPLTFLAIATIAVGAGLLFQGSMIAAEYSKLINRIGAQELRKLNIGGGLSTEVMAGGAGVALGILALLGVAPYVLLPVSVIVLGGAIALSANSISQLNDLKIMHSGISLKAQNIAGSAVDASSGAQILIGLGAAVLGILSIIGVANAMVLSTIAILALGFSILITGLSLSGRAFKSI